MTQIPSSQTKTRRGPRLIVTLGVTLIVLGGIYAMFDTFKPSMPSQAGNKPVADQVAEPAYLERLKTDAYLFNRSRIPNGGFITDQYKLIKGRLYLCALREGRCEEGNAHSVFDPQKITTPSPFWVPISNDFFHWYYQTRKVRYLDYSILIEDRLTGQSRNDDHSRLLVRLLIDYP